MQIYNLGNRATEISPDATVLADGSCTPQLNLVKTSEGLFPEAASDLQADTELSGILAELQSSGVVDLSRFRRFGIQDCASEVVQTILDKYVAICRVMAERGLNFKPGPQYNFRGLSPDGVDVTYGDYGLFQATLIEASRDPRYRQYLIERGQELFGDRSAFFVNPPATNTVVHCKDGRVLFVKRGITAEYPFMLHEAAAGHHKPVEQQIVTLRQLILQQIQQETGVSDIGDFHFNGIAFSSGSTIDSTEKAELLTSASVDLTDQQVFEIFNGKAPHKWEVARLCSIGRKDISQLIAATDDCSREFSGLPEGVRVFGQSDNFGELGRDPNSVSYWVPVGLAGMRAEMQRQN